MPRDLFGDVTRPSISIGNRKWYTVPVSLLSHAAVLATIVIVPLLAAPMLPGVTDNSPLTRLIDVVPPTPPPPPRKAETLKPIDNPNAAPTQAPPTIGEEPERFDTPEKIIPGIIGGDINGDPSVLAPPPAPKPIPKSEPVRVGGTVRTPIKTVHVNPVYPPIAQSARIQGIVIIEATISEQGRVINARILRSVPLLDQAAIDAVRQWEFTPTQLNGVAVPVIMTVTVNFTLQ